MRVTDELTTALRELLEASHYVKAGERDTAHYSLKFYEMGDPKRIRIDIKEKDAS